MATTKSAITKEQWENLEEEMAGYWVDVEFKLNGYLVSINRVRSGEGKTELAVYIDGTICGSWMSARTNAEQDEVEGLPTIIRDVWKLKTKAYYTPKKVKEIEKIFGKRRAKKEFPKLHDRHGFYLPYFPKASVLCRQFKKLEGLELVKAAFLTQ
ncbi:hypothetical protein C9J12_08205 [Photobacterium frigidiphilum]|uniref:Uncharacterized protein n=1 Tax=Photobacterium frigidiphilum TaxID=264736 RepID=A0A2T3JKB0_9GAMM|nr:hypothetical protein [Photobacterium frigidiphilum]PSU49462.1 hypothetical protein C9J12_08205 [Photobacterium frigidiphilum]